MIETVDFQYPHQDIKIEDVASSIRNMRNAEARWASVVRQTYDSIYNGRETGRYKWDQLMKTEKTHFGTLFEIYAQREFQFEDGDATDFRIAGHQVDAKWSQRMGGWMLPPEVFGRIALVATGDDRESVWSLGLVRVSEINRSKKGNRDQKSSLSKSGREDIRWIWKDAQLRPNVLLQLPGDAVARIFSFSSGQQRVDELFRQAEGCIVHRTIVETAAIQLDAQKRVRYNGGSRSRLAPEGYIILSGTYHADLAARLGIPVPLRDEYISVRVIESNETAAVEIDGRRWRKLQDGETPTSMPPYVKT